MLFASGAKDDVLGIAVIFDPPLLDVVDDSPSPVRNTLQDNVDVLKSEIVDEKGT
jgi:hypothetical protein